MDHENGIIINQRVWTCIGLIFTLAFLTEIAIIIYSIIVFKPHDVAKLLNSTIDRYLKNNYDSSVFL